MTISSDGNRKTFAGNGVTTAFAFPFRFLLETDLVVTLVNRTTQVETLQVLTTNYTTTGADAVAGGTVTMLIAPPASDDLVIFNDPDAIQPNDYVESGEFPVEEVEKAHDRAVILIQRLRDQLIRTLRTSDGSSEVFSGILPAPLTPLFFFRLNAAGDALELVEGITDLDLTLPGGTGMLSRIDTATLALRAITATANETSVADGDGVAGNPTVGLADNPTVPGTANLLIPVGTTAQRPGSPINGMIRYSSTLNRFEARESGVWVGMISSVRAITTKTANYTATAGDSMIFCNATSGAFTITLPVGVMGKVYTIKKIDTSGNKITLSPDGAETIDGEVSQALNLPFHAVSIISDGSNWHAF